MDEAAVGQTDEAEVPAGNLEFDPLPFFLRAAQAVAECAQVVRRGESDLQGDPRLDWPIRELAKVPLEEDEGLPGEQRPDDPPHHSRGERASLRLPVRPFDPPAGSGQDAYHPRFGRGDIDPGGRVQEKEYIRIAMAVSGTRAARTVAGD